MVNCLYNGVELPTLPVLPYQYAVIYKVLGVYHIYAYESPLVFDLSSARIPIAEGTAFAQSVLSDGTWSVFDEGVAGPSASQKGVYVWTSTDILVFYRNVYYAASEPVPVGTITHIPSFLMGVEVGRRLRALRGMREPVVIE